METNCPEQDASKSLSNVERAEANLLMMGVRFLVHDTISRTCNQVSMLLKIYLWFKGVEKLPPWEVGRWLMDEATVLLLAGRVELLLSTPGCCFDHS